MNQTLSDKILEENVMYIDTKDYNLDVKQELVRLYKNNDIKEIRKLARTICFVYDNFYKGYQTQEEAFNWARSDLDRFAEDADEDLMNIENRGKIQEFYRKSVGHFGENKFFKNSSLN
jgi:hypothetical protein